MKRLLRAAVTVAVMALLSGCVAERCGECGCDCECRDDCECCIECGNFRLVAEMEEDEDEVEFTLLYSIVF